MVLIFNSSLRVKIIFVYVCNILYKIVLTIEIWMHLLYQLSFLFLRNFCSRQLSRREKKKCYERQLDIRQWNLRNSRTCPFDILMGECAYVRVAFRAINHRQMGSSTGLETVYVTYANYKCHLPENRKKQSRTKRAKDNLSRLRAAPCSREIVASNNRQYPLLRRVHLANALDVWCCHDPWNTKDEHVWPQPHMLASLFRFRIHDHFLDIRQLRNRLIDDIKIKCW